MSHKKTASALSPASIADLVSDKDATGPIYLRLANAIKTAIAQNRLRGGAIFPSERSLANRLNCHRNTVHSAYEALMEAGYLARRNGQRRVTVADSAPAKYKASFPAIGIIMPGGFQRFMHTANRAVLAYLSGIVDRATQRGHSITLLTLPPPETGRREHQLWRESFISRTSGLVYLSGHDIRHTPLESILDDARIPQVYVSGLSRRPHISSVVADIQPGGQSAAALLRDLGHRDIGMFRSDWAKEPASDFQPAAQFRPEVMRECFAAAGLTIKQQWTAFHNRGKNAVEREISRILALRRRPTAFWCQNDDIAFEVLTALRQRGIDVPHDVSLIGFDDIESDHPGKPFLTTIRQPRYAMGQQAVDVAIEIYDQGLPGTSRHVEIPTALVVRDSTARVK